MKKRWIVIFKNRYDDTVEKLIKSEKIINSWKENWKWKQNGDNSGLKIIELNYSTEI